MARGLGPRARRGLVVVVSELAAACLFASTYVVVAALSAGVVLYCDEPLRKWNARNVMAAERRAAAELVTRNAALSSRVAELEAELASARAESRGYR